MNGFWETGLTTARVPGRIILWARYWICGRNVVRAVGGFEFSDSSALMYAKTVFFWVKWVSSADEPGMERKWGTSLMQGKNNLVSVSVPVIKMTQQRYLWRQLQFVFRVTLPFMACLPSIRVPAAIHSSKILLTVLLIGISFISLLCWISCSLSPVFFFFLIFSLSVCVWRCVVT